MRRLLILAIAVAIGLAAGDMVRGEWPEISWRGMTWVEPERPELPADEEILELAGLTPVTGPGIRITVTDATRRRNRPLETERLIVHERDLLMIRNELFAAGAEAVAINGNRLVAVTEIRCVGPAISINGRNTVPPYIVEAAGDPQVLKQSVMMMGGVVDLLAEERLKVEIDTVENLEIPAYDGGAKKDIVIEEKKEDSEKEDGKKEEAEEQEKKTAGTTGQDSESKKNDIDEEGKKDAGREKKETVKKEATETGPQDAEKKKESGPEPEKTETKDD